MYIYKTHVSKASFTLTQLSTQHLFLENSSKAVNSPIVLLLLCITTRQLSWKKIQWISNLFPAKIFCGEKDLDTLVSLGMMKNKMQVRNPKTFNDQIQGQFKHCEEIIAFIYIHRHIPFLFWVAYAESYLSMQELSDILSRTTWLRSSNTDASPLQMLQRLGTSYGPFQVPQSFSYKKDVDHMVHTGDYM